MDKLERINTIRDEAEKLEVLQKIRMNIVGSWGSINTICGYLQRAIAPITLHIDDSLTKINKNLNTLVGIMSDFVYKKSETEAANQDTQLTDVLSSPAEASPTFVGEGGSATAVSSNEPVLIALGKINEAIVNGLDSTTNAVKETSKQEQALQLNNTKALIANDIKRQQAEDRNRLLNPNKKKEQVTNPKENKPVVEPPKFPINPKEFMAGLGNILKAILNPITLIAGIFMHLLPYIILGIAFFKGVWSTLSDKAKEQVIEIRDKIIFYAGLAFLLFKGPSILIATLTTIWHTLKVGALMAKWAFEVAFHKLRMLFTTTEHAEKMSETMFERMCTMIEHVANKALIALKQVLAIAEYVLVAGGVVAVVAAIVLLIAGIIVIFALFGDKIIDACKKIVEVFVMVGGMIYDAIVGIVKLFCDIIVSLVTGILGGLVKAVINGFRYLFGGKTEEEIKAKTAQVTEVKNGVTKDVFTSYLKPISDSLNSINNCVANIAELEEARRWNKTENSFTRVASSGMTIFNGNSNIMRTLNADNTAMMINTSYVADQQKESEISGSFENDMKTVAKILSEWDRAFKNNTRNKLPNEIMG